MTDGPAQKRERLQWTLDAVRANQSAVGDILKFLTIGCDLPAKQVLDKLSKHDRDGILQGNGILTDEQIEVLS